jgi:hypothetical protein
MQSDNDGKASEAKVETSAQASAPDVVFIRGRSKDGKRLSVIRHRDNQLEHGLVVPLEHGKPIHGEVVRLTPRPEFPLLCDVHVECADPTVRNTTMTDAPAPKKGPGQVATEQYRNNWERIFDRKPPTGEGLN